MMWGNNNDDDDDDDGDDDDDDDDDGDDDGDGNVSFNGQVIGGSPSWYADIPSEVVWMLLM